MVNSIVKRDAEFKCLLKQFLVHLLKTPSERDAHSGDDDNCIIYGTNVNLS